MSLLLVLVALMLATGGQEQAIPFLDSSSSNGCPQGQTMLENECVNVPKLLKQKPPEYPEVARIAKLQATVELMAILQPDGTVGEVRVTKPSGAPKAGFEDAAIKAVKKWRYEPVVSHGKPIAVQFKVSVEFKMSGN